MWLGWQSCDYPPPTLILYKYVMFYRVNSYWIHCTQFVSENVSVIPSRKKKSLKWILKLLLEGKIILNSLLKLKGKMRRNASCRILTQNWMNTLNEKWLDKFWLKKYLKNRKMKMLLILKWKENSEKTFLVNLKNFGL